MTKAPENMSAILKVLALVASIFFTGYFLDSADTILEENYIEVLAELFTLFISFSIFAITWNAYIRSRDNHALFMGAAFFVIGFLDLFHTLSYPFMPDFITPNSPHKSALFWVFARLVSAPLFLASVFIYKDRFPRLINKPVLVLAIVPAFIFAFLVLFYHDHPLLIVGDSQGSSIARILSVSISAAIVLYSGYLYTKRIKKTGEENLTFLIYGFIIVALSDAVYFSYEISGHLLKIAGFYYIYIALYKSSVEQPYIKLAEAEEKLRHAAEERYRNLFENAHDAIVITDLEDRIISWNRSSERIFGWSALEVMGKEISRLIVPENLRAEREHIISDVLSGRTVSGIETMRLRRDGTMIYVSPTVSPIRDREQNIIGLSHIIRDITEHIRAEELRLENERLILASQTKSEFLATMSHELRTPLNAVLGFSELLKQKKVGGLSEKQENYVDNVIKSGKHLLNLINDILDLTRVEAGKIELTIERIAVPEAVNETLDLIKTTAEKSNVLLKKEIDPQLEFIEADQKRFKQILFNLISNAVKFSKKEGGTITIAAKKEGDMAKFSVSDTGIGIKEEDMEKLFRVFQQLDSGISRKYGGTGLGLAITRQFVELQGGKIWAESRYGEGSTFTFLLPLRDEKDDK